MMELEVNPDKSLQGGLRAARRAVRLLNQLGRSTQVKLFNFYTLLWLLMVIIFSHATYF